MKKYSRVEFHSPIFAQGVNIGKNLPSSKTFQELEMTFSPEGMLVRINDTNYHINNVEITVPWANIVWAQAIPAPKEEIKHNVKASK